MSLTRASLQTFVQRSGCYSQYEYKCLFIVLIFFTSKFLDYYYNNNNNLRGLL